MQRWNTFRPHRYPTSWPVQRRLRKKIETATAGESPIRASRGRGYVFAAPFIR